jgi:hypothetical protein
MTQKKRKINVAEQEESARGQRIGIRGLSRNVGFKGQSKAATG